MFEELHGYLVRQGIRTVLTACPNCTKIFRQYGHGLVVKTVYEILHSPASTKYLTGNDTTFTVHDPCPLRNDQETQQAVRKMLGEMGLAVN